MRKQKPALLQSRCIYLEGEGLEHSCQAGFKCITIRHLSTPLIGGVMAIYDETAFHGLASVVFLMVLAFRQIPTFIPSTLDSTLHILRLGDF